MRPTNLILLTLSTLSVFISGAQAQDGTNKVRMVTLQDCIQLAVEHNLDLQIERINPRLSLYDIDIALAGWDPNFTISGRHNFNLNGGGVDPTTKLPLPAAISDQNSFSSSLGGLTPIGTTYSLFGNVQESYGRIGAGPFDNSSGVAGINLTQPLLKNFWFDGTRLNIAVSKNRFKYSELTLRQRVMNIVNSVELAYYDLIYDQENVKVQQQALQLAERLLQDNKKKVEVGALAPLDEKQAESQLAANNSDLISAQQTLRTQQNNLKSMLTDNYMAWYGIDLQPVEKLVAVPENLDLMEGWRVGMAQRPDLLQSKLDLERQGIQLKYYRNQLFPELDLTGTYGHNGTGREFSGPLDDYGNGNRPQYSYGAVLSIPLSNKAARSRYKQGKLDLEQALLALKRVEQNALVDIQNAFGDVRGSFQRVHSTHEARLYAEAALEAEQKKLDNGKSTSFQVLQLQRDLTARRSDEIRALADYNKSLAQIALKEGATLERRNVSVNLK